MDIDRRQFARLGFAVAGALLATSSRTTLGREADDSPPAKPAPSADSEAVEGLWVALERDEPESSRALLWLAAKPDQTVAFLKEKMKPLTLEPGRLDKLLEQLGSAEDEVWKPAFEELEYFDPRLVLHLETVMQVAVDYPKRPRVVAVMSGWLPSKLEGKQVEVRKVGSGGHNFSMVPGGSWWADADVTKINSNPRNNQKKKWTRAVRAIALLEHVGTPAAIAILKDMAGGHPQAQPTREAAESLARLDVRPR